MVTEGAGFSDGGTEYSDGAARSTAVVALDTLDLASDLGGAILSGLAELALELALETTEPLSSRGMSGPVAYDLAEELLGR